MSKINARFGLRKDESSHWYMVPVQLLEDFDLALEEANSSDEHDDFEAEYGHFRIYGHINNLTFSDPEGWNA